MATFVTIYEDEKGRFISDSEYPTWQEAYENRDQLSSYRETVQIIRSAELTQHLIDEFYEQSDEPTIHGSQFYLRGFKDGIDRAKKNNMKSGKLKEGEVVFLHNYTAPKVYRKLFFECLLTDQIIPVRESPKIIKKMGHIKNWKGKIWNKERFKNLLNKWHK